MPPFDLFLAAPFDLLAPLPPEDLEAVAPPPDDFLAWLPLPPPEDFLAEDDEAFLLEPPPPDEDLEALFAAGDFFAEDDFAALFPEEDFPDDFEPPPASASALASIAPSTAPAAAPAKAPIATSVKTSAASLIKLFDELLFAVDFFAEDLPDDFEAEDFFAAVLEAGEDSDFFTAAAAFLGAAFAAEAVVDDNFFAAVVSLLEADFLAAEDFFAADLPEFFDVAIFVFSLFFVNYLNPVS